MEPEPPREKIPSTGNSEEVRTHIAVSHRTASPAHSLSLLYYIQQPWWISSRKGILCTKMCVNVLTNMYLSGGDAWCNG